MTNNLAYSNPPIEFLPYSGNQVNNFSAPGLSPIFYNINVGDIVESTVTYYKTNPLNAEKTNANYLWDKYNMPVALGSRFIPSGTGTGWDRINAMKPDMGIIDAGLDNFVADYIRGEGLGLSSSQRWPDWELQILEKVKKTGMKYVYLTVPDILDAPYFKFYTYESMVKKVDKTPKFLQNGTDQLRDIEPTDILSTNR